jgi:hypothetical protein
MATKLRNLVPRIAQPKLKFRSCSRSDNLVEDGPGMGCVVAANAPDGRGYFMIRRSKSLGGYELLGGGLSCFDQGSQRWGFVQHYRSIEAAKRDAERLIRLDCSRSRVSVVVDSKGNSQQTLETYKRLGVRVLDGVKRRR